MKFSIPYLAKDLRQLPLPGKYKNQAVEAVIFNREDLENPVWETVWKSIALAAHLYGPENATFHFPVNHSDYVTDPFVRDRLSESLKRANDLGLHGVVVHSNRIHDIGQWEAISLPVERTRVVETLAEVLHQVLPSKTWLALENMPVMDNYGKEIDPLFVYPNDFLQLAETGLGVVWDVCHYTNTLANVREVFENKQNRKYYPNLQMTEAMDFLNIRSQIVHWHFSAFDGVCNPDTSSKAIEGVIPSKGTLGEGIYGKILAEVLKASNPNVHMVFEIQEESYIQRKEIIEMLKWVGTHVHLR
jgi:hypothetical protein